jgi:hypothetical protein
MHVKFSVFKMVVFPVVIIAAFAAITACDEVANAEKKQNPAQTIQVDELTLSPPSMSLFTDGGERAMTALLPEEIIDKVTVEWEVSNSDIAEIIVAGNAITVYPKAAGNAVVTVRIRPILEEFSLEGQNTEINATITVLDSFVLNNSWFLFFRGEESQQLTAVVPEAVLEVADIVWTVNTENTQSIALSGTGKTVGVEPLGLEPSGIITAKLEAKDPTGFNGNGRLAVCVVTVLEAPHITIEPVALQLGPGGTEKTVLMTAEYGPGRVDIFEPAVRWTSSDPSIIQVVENGSASLGYATTHITARAVNSGTDMATVTAALKIGQRPETTYTRPIPVANFTAPDFPIASVSLSGTPSAPIIKSDSTELITVTTTGGGQPPSDLNIEWDFSEVGVVELFDGGDPVNNSKKYARGVWQGTTAKDVTVTASSRSNPDKYASFTITVQPIDVTVSSVARSSAPVAGEQVFVAALQAEVNTVENRNILDWEYDHHELVVLTSSGERNHKAEIFMRNGAVVQNTLTVTVTALAAADNGVSKDTTVITLNPHKFNVTYNKNDVEGSTDTSSSGPHVYGSSAETLKTIASLSWAVEGMVFDGWAKTADGAVAYTDGAAVTALNGNVDAKTLNGTVVLYAKWSPAMPD